MKCFRIERAGVTVDRIYGRDAKEALREFAAQNNLPGEPVGAPNKAHLGVKGVGLFFARLERTTQQRVEDAERRARREASRGDMAAAAAWEREAERRRNE